jgi:hypothetical protein
VRRLADVNGDLTGRDLRAGFQFDGQRIPLINPQRGIFKPTQMRFLLSIRTVCPRPDRCERRSLVRRVGGFLDAAERIDFVRAAAIALARGRAADQSFDPRRRFGLQPQSPSPA